MLAGLGFLIHESWLNLRRQGLMALACVSTSAVALTILGVFVALACQLYAVLDGAPRRMEVHAFLRADLPREGAQAVLERCKQEPGIATARLVTREEAWEAYRKSYAHPKDLEGLKENPLPDKIELIAASPEETLRVAEWARGLTEVDQVNAETEVLKQLLSIFGIARTIGLIVGLVLAMGAMALVSNAIRMTLYSRRRDIRLMQLVGATDSFVRFPFVLEGTVVGLVGGLVACGIVGGGLHYYTTRILPSVPLINQFQPPLPLALLCAAILIAGAAVGLLGSLVSVRKFLHVA